MCTGDGLEKEKKQKKKDRITLQRYMRCVLMSAYLRYRTCACLFKVHMKTCAYSVRRTAI
jgi:hypothetical protein